MIASAEQSEKKLLTTGDIMLQCEVVRNTVWEWIVRGIKIHGVYVKLRARRYGSRYKCQQKDLDEFLERINTAARPVAETPAAEKRQADQAMREFGKRHGKKKRARP